MADLQWTLRVSTPMAAAHLDPAYFGNISGTPCQVCAPVPLSVATLEPQKIFLSIQAQPENLEELKRSQSTPQPRKDKSRKSPSWPEDNSGCVLHGSSEDSQGQLSPIWGNELFKVSFIGLSSYTGSLSPLPNCVCWDHLPNKLSTSKFWFQALLGESPN